MSVDVNEAVTRATEAAQAGGDVRSIMDQAFADVPTSGADERDNVNAVTKLLDEEEANANGEPKEGQTAGETGEPNQPAAANPKETVNPNAGNIEEIVVTGANGKETIKIDYNDKESIKKAFSMAHGSRKWQAAKDLAERKLKEIEPDYEDAKTTRDTIVSTFKEKGFKGLANLLLQDESGWQKLIDAEVEKALLYRSATPDVKAKIEQEEKYNDLLRQMKFQEEKNAKEAQRITQEKERAAAEAQQLAESTFNTMASAALKAQSFTGKLGDVELEKRLDDSVWNGVRKALEQLPDDTDVTPQMLNDLVSKEVAIFGKGLNKKVETEVKQKMENKKQESAVSLASAAQQGMGKSGVAEKFSEALDKGDTASAIKAWLSGGLKKR